MDISTNRSEDHLEDSNDRQPESEQHIPPIHSAPTPEASPAQPDIQADTARQAPVHSPVPITSQLPHPESAVSSGGAGLVVLQWLTYAFWGWAVLALSSLTAAIIANFINKADVGDFMPFAIAALVVLLPVAFVCDSLYSKKEPTKKTGAAMAVMLIHAVIFALCGVAALITVVISVFLIIIGTDSDTKGILVTLFSALIVSIYYAATLARTLNPAQFPSISKAFRFGMMATVGIIILLGIVGPVARERSLRNDRLIEDNLSSLSSDIGSYARANNKLPSDLSELTNIQEGPKNIIEKNLVEYRPNTKTDEAIQAFGSVSSLKDALNSNLNSRKIFYYELCVTYKEESSSGTRHKSDYYSLDGYDTYIDTYGHPAGRHCYKIKTNSY